MGDKLMHGPEPIIFDNNGGREGGREREKEGE